METHTRTYATQPPFSVPAVLFGVVEVDEGGFTPMLLQRICELTVGLVFCIRDSRRAIVARHQDSPPTHHSEKTTTVSKHMHTATAGEAVRGRGGYHRDDAQEDRVRRVNRKPSFASIFISILILLRWM